MEVKAKARFIRMSPRKVRLVVDVIRGLDVDLALAKLDFINKAAVRPVRKVLLSAVANARHNYDIGQNNLYIKKITVDEGPKLKRWQPRAHGRATMIRKRTSHINIVLEEKVPTEKVKTKTKKKESELAAAPVEKKKKIVGKESQAKKKDLAIEKAEKKEDEPVVRTREVPSKEKVEIKKTIMKDKISGKQRAKHFFRKVFRRKAGM